MKIITLTLEEAKNHLNLLQKNCNAEIQFEIELAESEKTKLIKEKTKLINKIDLDFIKSVEKDDFRINQDTGADDNALYIWNKVRRHVSLPTVTKWELPAWCETHKKYHVINTEYGCTREYKKI